MKALLQTSGKIRRQGRERGKRRRRKEAEEKVVEQKTTPSPEKETPPTSEPQPQPETRVSQSPVQTTPPAIPRNTSTYADILDTLRLLEEAPPPLPGSKSVEILPTEPEGKPPNNPPTANFTIQEVGVVRKTGPAHSSRSESKLQSIMNYLDDMERADEGRGTTAGKTIGNDYRGSGGVGEELETVASDVTSTILSQRMEIDNKNKSAPHN